MTGLEQITHEAESLPPPPSPDSPSVHLVKELVQLLTALLVAVYRGQPRPGGSWVLISFRGVSSIVFMRFSKGSIIRGEMEEDQELLMAPFL